MVFPPEHIKENDFYPTKVYEEAINRYPTVAHLVSEKARENKDKTWLIFKGKNYSYQDVDNLSDKLAKGLYEHGIRCDDKIAIFAMNSPEWILSYFAILKIGSIPVTVNTSFVKTPLVYNLKASDSKYLIIDCRLLESYKGVEDELDNIEKVIVIGKNVDEDKKPKKPYAYWEDIVNYEPDQEVKTVKLEKDSCAMILTSGTTGPSKVVMDSNAQFISTALFMIDVGGIKRESILYVYLPLFHIMALDMATIASMLANAQMVLVERFNPEIFWEDINRFNITHFHAIGPILEMLFKLPYSDLEKQHGPLTAIAYCSKEVWVEAKERFNISITGGYGSTEVGIPVSSPNNIVINGENPPGSCGIVGPHVDVKIMDENGRILPNGQTGEIIVRPKIPWTIFLEYYKMPEKTVEAFYGLWFHTGDAGYFDDEGFLYFVDRLKDAIRKKGENISSYEVEQVLLKYPNIVEAAVIPAPSEVGEDEVMAVLVLSDSDEAGPRGVIEHCKENMPRFWVPRYIRIVESLPRTPTGRIEKFKLKDEGVTEDTYDMKYY